VNFARGLGIVTTKPKNIKWSLTTLEQRENVTELSGRPAKQRIGERDEREVEREVDRYHLLFSKLLILSML
jgi:hypothetical protein